MEVTPPLHHILQVTVTSQPSLEAEHAAGPSSCKSGTEKVDTALAFRGLRVRMGLHAGLTDADSWSINQATGRWCASGERS